MAPFLGVEIRDELRKILLVVDSLNHLKNTLGPFFKGAVVSSKATKQPGLKLDPMGMAFPGNKSLKKWSIYLPGN